MYRKNDIAAPFWGNYGKYVFNSLCTQFCKYNGIDHDVRFNDANYPRTHVRLPEYYFVIYEVLSTTRPSYRQSGKTWSVSIIRQFRNRSFTQPVKDVILTDFVEKFAASISPRKQNVFRNNGNGRNSVPLPRVKDVTFRSIGVFRFQNKRLVRVVFGNILRKRARVTVKHFGRLV